MSLSYNTFKTHVVVHEAPTDSIKIVPFGDIHRDSHNCDEERWLNFLEKCKSEDDENTYYIGLGDYNDFASYTERQKLRHTLHESTSAKMDSWAMKDVEQLADELGFMKGRLLGLVHGNHEWEFMDGDLATEKLCVMLGCQFLGNSTYVRLKGQQRVHGGSFHLDIFASHGKGGGQLIGSPYNNVEKMIKVFPDADIYLMGHSHHKGAISKTALIAETGNNGIVVKQKRQWFGRTGSFLRGWVEDSPSYVVGALYPPTDLGTIKFDVSIKRDRSDGGDVIVKDIHCWS